MIVYPAIDLLRGACVRLYRGDYDRVTEHSRDPVEVARRFEDRGAPALHVVDLDGAREGEPVNAGVIRSIREAVDLPMQAGGGLRERTHVEELLDAGVERAVLGTGAAERPRWMARLVDEFGPHRIAAGVDVRRGEVVVRGWLEGTGAGTEEVLDHLEDAGVRTVIYTDVTRDGTLTEPDVEGVGRLVGRGFRTVAAGGISAPEHLRRLRDAGAAGAVVGSALYEGAMSLAEALNAAGGDRGDAGGAMAGEDGPC